jgi:hypothetical protein
MEMGQPKGLQNTSTHGQQHPHWAQQGNPRLTTQLALQEGTRVRSVVNWRPPVAVPSGSAQCPGRISWLLDMQWNEGLLPAQDSSVTIYAQGLSTGLARTSSEMRCL